MAVQNLICAYESPAKKKVSIPHFIEDILWNILVYPPYIEQLSYSQSNLPRIKPTWMWKTHIFSLPRIAIKSVLVRVGAESRRWGWPQVGRRWKWRAGSAGSCFFPKIPWIMQCPMLMLMSARGQEKLKCSRCQTQPLPQSWSRFTREWCVGCGYGWGDENGLQRFWTLGCRAIPPRSGFQELLLTWVYSIDMCVFSVYIYTYTSHTL